MNDKGQWPNRVLEFFRNREVRPLPPKPPRRSGPTEWTGKHHDLLGPQCHRCHENVLKGQELIDGKWCGECGGLPPAA